MKKYLTALVFALMPGMVLAAPAGVPLEEANIDLSDKASLQDGARTFVNYCMGCHSAEHQRYQRVADDLGISEELMVENLIFTDGTLIGEHMKNGMRREDAAAWLGAPAPDLTMVSRVRGEDWVYTYLKSFYEDLSRPLGANNAVFANVGMPNVLMELQGRQLKGCAQAPVREGGSVQRDPLTGEVVMEEQCDVLYVEEGTGTQTAEEFDTTVRNLAAFLAYSADPIKLERHRIGTYVLLYLAFFFIFAVLLKREYWKDIH
ncbi:cytochrome c1 [Halopseudomonas salegens]|uniref:Ubiquinol-cytochrome c reductase cytochrome c1 subunit n=1 Tax=Halopseudomonas salegens TaxID=1434072 RepID=A0A1H2GT12_9GAMM|nr:cytochrome c1 [Halopseudomonas salegens]SDU22621.1 ubiquinol-cytochrome c reductase cytochrome c1 subunit [Halopseudomonas salegens]